jgi:hypothetical protein
MMIQLMRLKGTTGIYFRVVGTDGKVQHQGEAEMLLLDAPNRGPEYSHLYSLYVEEAEHTKAGIPELRAQVMS